MMRGQNDEKQKIESLGLRIIVIGCGSAGPSHSGSLENSASHALRITRSLRSTELKARSSARRRTCCRSKRAESRIRPTAALTCILSA